MRGKLAKEIFRTVFDEVRPENVNKYYQLKNRIMMMPLLDENGEPKVLDGQAVLGPQKVGGTYVSANPLRRAYQVAKRSFKSHRRYSCMVPNWNKPKPSK